MTHHRVLRTVNDLPDVHGVIVVPEQRRVYATVTARNHLVALDEDTGTVVFTAPTAAYPDGLAYDPLRHTVWSTNESAGNETVVDAGAGAVVATVPLGGDVGNVVYDPATDRMVVSCGNTDLVGNPHPLTVGEEPLRIRDSPASITRGHAEPCPADRAVWCEPAACVIA